MRKQCAKCPWKVGANPRDIPGTYSEEKHRDLRATIASRNSAHLDLHLDGLRMMACHETPVGKEKPCVGWLVNQLGVGHNLALRFAVMRGLVDADVEPLGEQYERFEDTLPGKA